MAKHTGISDRNFLKHQLETCIYALGPAYVKALVGTTSAICLEADDVSHQVLTKAYHCVRVLDLGADKETLMEIRTQMRRLQQQQVVTFGGLVPGEETLPEGSHWNRNDDTQQQKEAPKNGWMGRHAGRHTWGAWATEGTISTTACLCGAVKTVNRGLLKNGRPAIRVRFKEKGAEAEAQAPSSCPLSRKLATSSQRVQTT